jgi:hypothetical protein
MDNDAIRLLATIGAVKLLLGRLFSVVYIESKMTPPAPDQLLVRMHPEIRRDLA